MLAMVYEKKNITEKMLIEKMEPGKSIVGRITSDNLCQFEFCQWVFVNT